MSIVAFPTRPEIVDAMCRKLFDAYGCKSRAILQQDHASARRYQAIYDRTADELEALGMQRDIAFRRGARL